MEDVTYKGYSLFSEKAFEESDTVIRGMATTVTPDRVSDVVVPEGVVFRTEDIKLHLYHDNRLPVGSVKFGKPTKKGIPFEARLPDVKEEGAVRERVKEAIHSVKYNLISAVSIGFKALEDGIEVMKSGGLKFTKWEMIELSLVSTPANPEAIITAMKSMQPLSADMVKVLRDAENDKPSWCASMLKPQAIKLISSREGHLKSGAVELIRR